MEDKRQGVLFYRSFRDAIKYLPPENQLELINAILDFGLDDINPENLSEISRGFWELIKPQLEANIKKYDNAKRGGRPSNNKDKNQNETSGYESEKPKRNQNETKTKANIKDNININVNDNKKEKEKTLDSDFEIIYQAYQLNAPPQGRTSKKESLDKYKSLVKNNKLPPIEIILQKIKEYDNSLDPKEKWQFKKGFQVWLNKECWLDDYKSAEPNGRGKTYQWDGVSATTCERISL